MTILHGDCRLLLPTLHADSIAAVVTDPPYHLTTAKAGGSGSASLNENSPAGRARIGTGFMGKAWDGGDVAFDPATWAAVLRVMKPGAYLLAFGGTRTYHRMVCAIEDAGFEIRDQLAWLYGSGFPKGTDRAKIPETWKGWNTALKPAHEPIVLARKPLIGTLADNLAAHGTGALNIDGCRIAMSPQDAAEIASMSGFGRDGYVRPRTDETFMQGCESATQATAHQLGRWPANLLHDGSAEVLDVFPHTSSGKPCGRKAGNNNNVFGQFAGGIPVTGFGDAGSAARFFYCAKASREDRSEGLAGFERKPMNWSSGEQSPGTFQSPNTDRASENFHPTVKPTELMRYLVRLVAPPGGVVLDPFAGSGSTGKACALEGVAFVGIEAEAEYVAIAEARIAHALTVPVQRELIA